MSANTLTTGAATATADSENVISVRGLKKHFPIKEGVLQKVSGHVRAVDGVDFDVPRGTTLGLVGESGCGKSTLGRVISGLMDPTDGGVYFRLDADARGRLDELLAVPDAARSEAHARALDELEAGHRVDRLIGSAWDEYRRNCQVVFQDSFSSLNPRQLVKDIVGRPLRIHDRAAGGQLTDRVVELLESVGLGSQHLYRYPHQFSGGQRQRLSIARALALDPEFIVLDEPTSALDVSVQAQILNLLHVLQEERGLTYLFITHDLGVVRHMSDNIVVMYLGRVAERGRSQDVFDDPKHPYTEALLAANPDVEVEDRLERIRLEGSVPDPASPPSGCRFHTRCPVATPDCGWDVGDVLQLLESRPEEQRTLESFRRHTPFHADLEFADAGLAAEVVRVLEQQAKPPMAQAMRLEQDGATVTVRFHEVPEVELLQIAAGHVSACILNDAPPV
jgi:oligopeptide/dipeptide ABC transporter ATP-binding protein